jgi:hypothetical protein
MMTAYNCFCFTYLNFEEAEKLKEELKTLMETQNIDMEKRQSLTDNIMILFAKHNK